ncbi:hypothetical protein GCM10020358_53760 [Amorphoplanes nipponensis]
MPAVLMVVSAADRWTLLDGSRHPTGFWAEEFAEPHRLFRAAGWRVTVATPDGRVPTVDRLSLRFPAGSPWRLRRYRRYLAAHADELRHPSALHEVDPADYDLVFYPGGHGPMEDLAADPVSGALLARTVQSGRPLALLCHAPAATLAAVAADGSWPFAGYTMTGLSQPRGAAQPVRAQGAVAARGPAGGARRPLRQGRGAAAPARERGPQPLHRTEPRLVGTAGPPPDRRPGIRAGPVGHGQPHRCRAAGPGLRPDQRHHPDGRVESRDLRGAVAGAGPALHRQQTASGPSTAGA